MVRLLDVRTKGMLKQFGLPIPRRGMAGTPDEACVAGEDIAASVAIKTRLAEARPAV